MYSIQKSTACNAWSRCENSGSNGGLYAMDGYIRCSSCNFKCCDGIFVPCGGASLHASIGTMSGCLLNIVLDPIFILPWGLDMGAEGAGLATFISNCVACFYFFVLMYKRRGKTLVCIHPSQFGFQKAIVFGVCGVGIPAAIQNLLNVTGMTILNNFTSAFGSEAVAAMGITQKSTWFRCISQWDFHRELCR